MTKRIKAAFVFATLCFMFVSDCSRGGLLLLLVVAVVMVMVGWGGVPHRRKEDHDRAHHGQVTLPFFVLILLSRWLYSWWR